MSSVKPTVLAICAHPDDAEFRCAGTLLLLAKAGWDVHIATLTPGDCGSAVLQPNEIAAIRRQEAVNAAARIGGTYHCLGGQDLKVFDDDVMRAATIAVVREVRPEVIITHFPVDYMPDHDTASAVARCAAFTASIKNYVTGPAASLPPVDGPIALYYFGPLGNVDWFGNTVKSEFYVDITSVIEDKAEALGCHNSQREWLRVQHGMDQYIEEMRRMDKEAGEVAGVTYAEGFTMHRGHGYPQEPLIENALGGLIKRP